MYSISGTRNPASRRSGPPRDETGCSSRASAPRSATVWPRSGSEASGGAGGPHFLRARGSHFCVRTRASGLCCGAVTAQACALSAPRLGLLPLRHSSFVHAAAGVSAARAVTVIPGLRKPNTEATEGRGGFRDCGGLRTALPWECRAELPSLMLA